MQEVDPDTSVPFCEVSEVEPTPLDHARSYIARGWNPVPLPYRTKAPLDDGWQARRIAAGNVAQFFFERAANVGIVLGPSSGGLTDVDLDCAEAIEAGNYILPTTRAIFGRTSAPGSHRLYVTNLGKIGPKAVYAFDDPDPGDAKARLVELRCGGAKGAQTVFPGSVHRSGEPIRWDEDGVPAAVDGADLLHLVRLLAAASLIARAWPSEGARHDAARILGGLLARVRTPTRMIKPVAEGIARAARDPEVKDRIAAAADAAEAFQRGERAYGFPALIELVGERRARKIGEWIGYETTKGDANPDRDAVEKHAAASLIMPTPFIWQNPSTFPRRQWLLGHDYCRKYLSGLISPGASGKSSLMLIEALVLITGRPLLGVRPRETVKVWYFNGEDPREETVRRLLAAMKFYGISPDEVEGRLFVDSGRDTPITIAETGRDGTRIATPIVEAITQRLIDHEVSVMLVDPFVSTHGVGENDNVAINAVARQWGLIAERSDGAIGLAHHARKPGGETVTTETSRGASALIDAVRIGRALNKMTQTQAEELGVEEPNRYFRIGGADSPGKHNMAPPIDKTKWFKIESVDLENAPKTGNVFQDMAGPQSDLVGVVATWEPPNLIDNVETVAQLEEIQRRASAGRWRKSPQSVDEPWVGILVAEVLKKDLDKPGERRVVRKLIGLWLEKKALEEYTAKDAHGEEKPYIRGGKGDG